MTTDTDAGPTSPPGDPGVPAARLDRVRKLLAKAERAGTPDEAEIYTAKAVELMARHGIDDAVLAAADPLRTADRIGSVRIEIDDPYSAGKARLLGWTASALRCRWVMHDARGGRVPAVTVFGFDSDRERAELLYTSLLLQAARPLAELRPPRADESVSAYRRSWLYGFAARIHERLREAEGRAVRERDDAVAGSRAGSSTALVLADRTDEVDRAYAEEFPSLRRARRPAVSGSGYRHGADAADRADLGGGPELGGPGRGRVLPPAR
ncbi:DUF2786 domain-containing protein [Pseudonocardia sp. KRD291]|uniref:DUF2786 domain-containing protein n=1 Tax=Pseudonocardia sp. KRD291 TaxID=2792007 RepID=UPI001C4A2D69|nr:DUF2786 domain-containing protein [Pseudonocardia sp. KRD291]MBW0101499.1 DUF2786 domain-containing protein [Pseudonocardia sp. KRD291]